VLGNLGNILTTMGRYEEARAAHEEGLSIQRELGDRRGQATNLGDLAAIAINLGDMDLANHLNGQSIQLYADLGDTRSAAERRVMQCFIDIQTGKLDSAMTTLLVCREQFERDEDWFSFTVTKTVEASILLHSGQPERAQPILLEAIREDHERHQMNGLLMSLDLAMRCRAAVGDHLNAIRLYSALGQLRLAHSIAEAPAGKAEMEQLVGELRAAVGEDAYLQAERDGSSMDAEACVGLLGTLIGTAETVDPAA
jgi:tetratricopeptide (TPR) repeat protein